VHDICENKVSRACWIDEGVQPGQGLYLCSAQFVG
jgi:hypothetical protein